MRILSSLVLVLFTVNAFAITSNFYPVMDFGSEDEWFLGYNIPGPLKHTLQDYSYAGYKANAVPLPNWKDFDLPVFKVDDYGAPSASQGFADDAIRTAIGHAEAAGGGIVAFSNREYKVRSRIEIKSSHIILVGSKSFDDPSDDPSSFTRIYSDFSGFSGGLPPGLDANYAVFRFGNSLTWGDTYSLSPENSPLLSNPLYPNIEAEGGDGYDIIPNQFQLKLTSVEGLQKDDHIVIRRIVTSSWLESWDMTSRWSDWLGKTKVTERVTISDVDYENNIISLYTPTRHLIKGENVEIRKVSAIIKGNGVYNIKFNTSFPTKHKARELHTGSKRFSFINIRNATNFIASNIESYDRGGDDHQDHVGDSGIWASKIWSSTFRGIKIRDGQNLRKNGHGYGLTFNGSSNSLVIDSEIGNMRHSYVLNDNVMDNTANVFSRCKSWGSTADNHCLTIGKKTYCFSMPTNGFDFHGRAAEANLINKSEVYDTVKSVDRGKASSDTGKTSTNSVVWHLEGDAKLKFKDNKVNYEGFLPYNYRHTFNYIIGTGKDIKVVANDSVEEHLKASHLLEPDDLFCHQLQRRFPLRSCDFEMPVLSILSEEQNACHNLQQEIDSISNSIQGLNDTIAEVSENPGAENGEVFQNSDLIIADLQSQINGLNSQMSLVLSQYNSFNEVGCDEILAGDSSDPEMAAPVNNNEFESYNAKEFYAKKLGFEKSKKSNLDKVYFVKDFELKNEKGEIIDLYDIALTVQDSESKEYEDLSSFDLNNEPELKQEILKQFQLIEQEDAANIDKEEESKR